MRTYLISGGLFGLLALAHVVRTIAEWPRVTTDPSSVLVGPGIGVGAAALSVWAFRLLRAGRAQL